MEIPKPTFKRMCLMHLQQLTNFPYIEKDFDALTDYELLCKVVDYLNEVIKNENGQNQTLLDLYNAYLYLKNYLETLDLQEYVDNKIDEMVEDGTIERILNDAAHLIRRYNTLTEMIENKAHLSNGMIVYTYGKNEINDGDGAKYLINDESGEIDLENGLFAKILDNIESNFYNLKTYNEEHYDSNCYFVEIPYLDDNGNEIEIFTAYHPNLSPNEYSIKEKTSVTVNSSLSYETSTTGYPNIIGKGELLVNDPITNLPEGNVYLCLKANREIAIYDRFATYEQMLSGGVLNNACIWGQTAISGNYVDIGVGEAYSPRTMLGVKADKTFIFMVVNGRTTIDKGVTFEQATYILLDKACIDVYALDGGGSTSLSVNTLKLNKNIDGHGLSERRNGVTFNVKKQIVNNMSADTTSEIGKAKINILNNIMPLINEIGTTISDYDLNDLNNKLYLSYGANMVNAPLNGYGYLVNIPHLGAETGTEYSQQLFIQYQTSRIFKRQKVGDEFTPWESILGNKLYAVYDGETNIILTADNAYQNCYFRTFKSTISDLISIDTSSPVHETNYYENIKINKAGTYKITAQLFIRPDVTGNKNVQISKNGANTNFNIAATYIESNKYGCVEVFMVNDFAKDDYINIKARGNIGDSVVRARVIVEEF